MKNQFQKPLQVALIVIALLSIVGCGTSKTGGEGFGSADQSSTGEPSTSTDALALCSQNLSTTGDNFQVRLMQYKDNFNQTRADYVRLQFKIAPAAWQAGNWDMMVYRWTAAPDNSTSLDSSRLSYQFERRTASGFQLLHSNSYSIFNYDEVEGMAAYANTHLNANLSASSPQAFFNDVSLLVNLRDSTNSFQVLRVVFKQGSSVVSQADVLIPTFQANPAKYNTDARHPSVLQALHPLKDKLGQSWTEANYYEFANTFCF